MSALSSFIFTASEILRTDNPLPVQSVKPWFDDNQKTIGSIVTVVLPKRSWAVLSVKIPDTAPLQVIGADVPLTATFENLVAKPYAMPTEKGGVNAGMSARADAVELRQGTIVE